MIIISGSKLIRISHNTIEYCYGEHPDYCGSLFLSVMNATNLIHPYVDHLNQPFDTQLLESDDDFDLQQLLLTTFRLSFSS